MTLVSTEQAIAHLRADTGEDISVYLGAAELSAMAYLNRQVYATPDEMAAGVLSGDAGDDPILIDDAIKAAILLTLGHLYRNREDVIAGQSAGALALPLGARSLLQSKRIGLGV
jgi:hypothetical protein